VTCAFVLSWEKSAADQRRNGRLLISGSWVRVPLRPPANPLNFHLKFLTAVIAIDRRLIRGSKKVPRLACIGVSSRCVPCFDAQLILPGRMPHGNPFRGFSLLLARFG